jgi:hypothetical protein
MDGNGRGTWSGETEDPLGVQTAAHPRGTKN